MIDEKRLKKIEKINEDETTSILSIYINLIQSKKYRV